MAVGYLPFAKAPVSTTTTCPCVTGGLLIPGKVSAAFNPPITNQPSSALFFASIPSFNLIHGSVCISSTISSAIPDNSILNSAATAIANLLQLPYLHQIYFYRCSESLPYFHSYKFS